jgi:hypothetical protein
MKRRRLLAVGLAIVPFAFAAACAFPDVTFAPDADDDAGAEGGPTNPDAGDAAFESSIPDDVDPDGHLADAATADKDATTAIDAAGCTSCDCDGDEHTVLDAGFCDGAPGPRPDCDDAIPAIKPSQTFLTNDTWPDASTHDVPFDWNCDRTVTKQLPYDVKCTTSSCGEGFSGNPDCGEAAEWVKCNRNVSAAGIILSCSKGPTDTRRQGCR